MEFYTISGKKVSFDKWTKILTISNKDSFKWIYKPDWTANIQMKSETGEVLIQNIDKLEKLNIQGKISNYIYSFGTLKVLR